MEKSSEPIGSGKLLSKPTDEGPTILVPHLMLEGEELTIADCFGYLDSSLTRERTKDED